MTEKQEKLYWREWAAVRFACKRRALTEPDRHELHAKALGEDKSHKSLNNADFDRVLAEFRSWSQPENVSGQVRQIEQPRTRSLRKAGELMACLELYHPDPVGYVREIIRDKFNRGSSRQVSDITDLSSEPQIVTNRSTGEPREIPSQIDQLIMTLGRVVNGKDGYRARAKDSVHTMLTRAGLKCHCAQCSPRKKAAMMRMEQG